MMATPQKNETMALLQKKRDGIQQRLDTARGARMGPLSEEQMNPDAAAAIGLPHPTQQAKTAEKEIADLEADLTAVDLQIASINDARATDTGWQGLNNSNVPFIWRAKEDGTFDLESNPQYTPPAGPRAPTALEEDVQRAQIAASEANAAQSRAQTQNAIDKAAAEVLANQRVRELYDQWVQELNTLTALPDSDPSKTDQLIAAGQKYAGLGLDEPKALVASLQQQVLQHAADRQAMEAEDGVKRDPFTLGPVMDEQGNYVRTQAYLDKQRENQYQDALLANQQRQTDISAQDANLRRQQMAEQERQNAVSNAQTVASLEQKRKADLSTAQNQYNQWGVATQGAQDNLASMAAPPSIEQVASMLGLPVNSPQVQTIYGAVNQVAQNILPNAQGQGQVQGQPPQQPAPMQTPPPAPPAPVGPTSAAVGLVPGMGSTTTAIPPPGGNTVMPVPQTTATHAQAQPNQDQQVSFSGSPVLNTLKTVLNTRA